MDEELEDLIREIAMKHGIAVSRDDPVLVLQTINHRLIQMSSKAQQAQLDKFKHELEGLIQQWGDDAKGRADRIVNAALVAGRDAIGQVMQEAAHTTAATVSAEMDAALVRLVTATRDARQIAILNLVAACITVVASAVALCAVLR